MSDKKLAQMQARMAREEARHQREREQARREAEWQQAKSRLMIEMSNHIGKSRAIGAGELYELVFLEPYEGNKMTGTRRLRKLIEEVKYDAARPIFIAASCCTIRPGYYLPSTDSERREYLARQERKVKKKIGRLARLAKVRAGDYAGQLALSIQQEGK